MILADRGLDTGISQILVAASVSQYAPLFGLGALLFLYSDTGRLHPVAWLLVVLIFTNEGLVSGWTNAAIVFGIALAFIAVIHFKDVPVLRHKWLLWLGAISYPLYLLHQNIGYVIINATLERLGQWPSRALAVAVVLVLAWAVHEVVEVRFSRWAHRRLQKAPSPAASDSPTSVAA